MHQKVHPRILDHTRSTIYEAAQYAEDLSHGFAKYDFDYLQDIANLLRDWADEKSGVIFHPKPKE